MKYLFSIIILLHGTIHLIGFAKAFNLAEVPQLSIGISKLYGLIWLLVFILFTISGIACLSGTRWWSILAIIAVIISVLLSFLVWKDARFASIPNIIILVVASLSLAQVNFNNKVSNEISQIMEETDSDNHSIVSPEELSGLPSPVAKWLEVSGVVGKEKANTVCLSQKVRMKLKPGQDTWNDATAEQYFTTQNPAFIWKVEMNMSPFIKITGRDRFANGKGEMMIKLFSIINIANEKGVKIDEGTLQRYLGEIVWFPSAALSPYISWEEIDSLSAKASMNYKGTSGSGIFHFNENGDFIQYSTFRYKGNEAGSVKHEWLINVNDRAIINGIKIPVKMKATWKLDDGDWTWLDMELTDVKYNTKFISN
jgi:hypothetical protein